MLSSFLAPIWALFEAFWDHLGSILGPFAAISGPSWGHVVRPWSHLGSCLAILDAFWNLLEDILVPLEPSWSLLVHLDASKEALGDHLGAIWVRFGLCWIHFQMIWVTFWNHF